MKVFDIVTKLINKKSHKSITVKEKISAETKNLAVEKMGKSFSGVRLDESSFELDNIIVKVLYISSDDDE